MSINLNAVNYDSLTFIDITSDEINQTTDAGLYLCEYNGFSSYLIVTLIYDPFFKKDVVNQIIFTFEDNKTYRVVQYKSRKYVHNLLSDRYSWSNWSSNDSFVFNYINEFIKDNYDRFVTTSEEDTVETDYTVSDLDKLTDEHGNTLSSILQTLTNGMGITTLRFWE